MIVGTYGLDREHGRGREAAPVVAYANEGELVISVARIALSLTLLVRSFLLDASSRAALPMSIRITKAAMVAAVSLWVAARARRRRLGLAAHVGLTLWDALICYVALRENVLHAGPEYTGLLRMPDTSFLIVIVFGTALRLYASAVLVAIGASALSLLSLIELDRAVHGAQIAIGKDIEVMVLQMAVAGAAALASSWAARRALRGLAEETARVTHGRRYLEDVLREHHDLRTLLSVAQLQLGLLRRDETVADTGGRLTAAEQAVDRITDIVNDIKTRTFGELAVTDRAAEVEPLAVLAGAVAVSRLRFPETAIEMAAPATPSKVLVYGGERALAHVFVNLLVNACEGDGSRRARRVRVLVAPETADDLLRIDFADDGPGFRPALLEDSFRSGFTTKREGSGVGLASISAIVEVSGGSLQVRNLSAGGACVSVRLRFEMGRDSLPDLAAVG